MKTATLEKRVGKIVIDKLRLPRLNKKRQIIRHKKTGDIVNRRIKNVNEFKKYYAKYLDTVYLTEMDNIKKIKSSDSLSKSSISDDSDGQNNLNMPNNY